MGVVMLQEKVRKYKQKKKTTEKIFFYAETFCHFQMNIIFNKFKIQKFFETQNTTHMNV